MKVKPNKGNGVSRPAIDSQPPVMVSGDLKLDTHAAAILQSLLRDRHAIDERIAYFVCQCARDKGIKIEEYGLNLVTLAFVAKPPQPATPKVIAQ